MLVATRNNWTVLSIGWEILNAIALRNGDAIWLEQSLVEAASLSKDYHPV